MVFLDTVGLLAIWDRSDQWHSTAATAFQQLQDSRVHLLTTTLVLAECANVAARRPYRLAVARLHVEMKASGGLITPSNEDWEEAWSHYQEGRPGAPGIVDHLSFIAMRRLGVGKAFTNDRHFKEAGYEILF